MFRRGGGVELLLVLCSLEASLSCPHHCICYTSPSTVSCQAHNFLTVPEGIPERSERVFLQNNRIERLLRGHFSPATAMLWLYSNNISYIQPSTFTGFTRLEELDLGDNPRLRSLAADTFQGLSRLHALHLYHCGLIHLPAGIFQGLHSMQYLHLQDNELEFLEDDLFVDLLNLSHLFLHGNRLWSLHQNTFRGLGALDRLLLHQNRLQWVDRLAFHDLRRLTTLYLFNNSLTELPAESLALLPALEYLRVNANPWECDCKALPLWDWLQRFRGSTSAAVCVAPAELEGRDLKQLRKEELPRCTSGVESLSQGKGGGGGGGEGGGGGGGGRRHNHLLPPNGHHPQHQNPHLPHQDQHAPPSPLPAPAPRPPTKAGRQRNCTRRGGGRKGKGQNEVTSAKEAGAKGYDPDERGQRGKYDPSTPQAGAAAPARRKHRCRPQTSVGPPSGVQQPNSGGVKGHGVSVALNALSLALSYWAVVLR
ncbi:reticulon-4 receptor-like 1 [Alosa sapidissima]|uniref:reticulon-4 receptor-like 1 n=1 Tax=Alosa sapidissima TaxID=34773 RepID=UPI001C09E102|nr:reticulon-4 receptor-like 1 [Alosa sapidissima]